MSEKKRKSFSADFKAKVALEAIHGVKTLNEIAREYGVHLYRVNTVQVSTRKKELQQQASTLFEQKRAPKPIDPIEDPEKLNSEIGRLRMELDWLKKVRRESRVPELFF
jgi:transposase-like protein